VRDGPVWQELLARQDGVVSAGQAAEMGWSRHALQAQVHAGRWTRPVRGVYVTRTGLLTYEQRIWVAVLSAGAGAVASHQTALWLHDRPERQPLLVHVTVPRSRNARRGPGLVVHRSDCDPRDVMPAASPARVRVERAVLETAAAAPSDETAVAVEAGAVQRRLTTAGRLQAVLERCPTLARRHLLRGVLTMCGRGAHSLLEVQHERIRRRHYLPEPRRQVRHGSAVIDVEYDGLVVELDGRAGHFNVAGWWRDMLRDDLHTASGRAVLRFPGFLLLTQPHVVAHLEAAALRTRGWPGVLRCPPGCPGFPEAGVA
jgi:very-short-patch-repair endonuclease